jgi:uncharacterized protein involved in exopolysaccharide biosynthesis
MNPLHHANGLELEAPVLLRDEAEVPRMLWHNRKMVLRFAYVGLLLGVVLAFILPSRYEATLRLMPPEMQSGDTFSTVAAMASRASGGGLGLEALAGDLLGKKQPSALFVGILKSDHVLNDLVQRFDLRRVYWTGSWKKARERLAERTDVSEDRKSGIITIQVQDSNPARAAAMAREYADSLDRTIASLNTSAAGRERQFLEQRLTVVKQELDDASRQLSEYSSQHATFDVKDQGKTMFEAAAKLQGQLVAEQSALNGLEQIYTSNNARVKQAQGRVAELQQQLKRIGGAGEGTQPADDALQVPSLRQLPVLGVRYADLYRRAKIEETVYELLTQKYELARVEEAKEVPVVRVLDSAEVPERKSFPPRAMIILLCGIFAGVVACGWLIAQRHWHSLSRVDSRKLLFLEIGSHVRDEIMAFRRRLAPSRYRTS